MQRQRRVGGAANTAAAPPEAAALSLQPQPIEEVESDNEGSDAVTVDSAERTPEAQPPQSEAADSHDGGTARAAAAAAAGASADSQQQAQPAESIEEHQPPDGGAQVEVAGIELAVAAAAEHIEPAVAAAAEAALEAATYEEAAEGEAAEEEAAGEEAAEEEFADAEEGQEEAGEEAEDAGEAVADDAGPSSAAAGDSAEAASGSGQGPQAHPVGLSAAQQVWGWGMQHAEACLPACLPALPCLAKQRSARPPARPPTRPASFPSSLLGCSATGAGCYFGKGPCRRWGRARRTRLEGSVSFGCVFDGLHVWLVGCVPGAISSPTHCRTVLSSAARSHPGGCCMASKGRHQQAAGEGVGPRSKEASCRDGRWRL